MKLAKALLGLGMISPVAHAVNLSTHGTGEVLIAPYYNVENGNATVLSIQNHTDRAKAVKVYFREAENNRPVLYFNLYLSANDVWTAQVADNGSGGVMMKTFDTSCTVPQSPSSGVDFRPFGYQNDGGDTSTARTREGYLEFIEMGVVASGSTDETAITHTAGIPNDCNSIIGNWAPGGKWNTDSSINIESPQGGLSAQVGIINVANGLEFNVPVTALDNFYADTGSLHASPGIELPTLASASPTSTVFIRSSDTTPAMSDDWSGSSIGGLAAVSTVLMSQTLGGPFIANPAVEFDTDWVITFPTKGLHTDRIFQPSTQPPFSGSYGTNPVCEPVSMRYWDREEALYNSPLNQLCYGVNVIQFGSSSVLDAVRTKQTINLNIHNGQAELRFAANATLTTPGGYVYKGLPAIGFAVKRGNNGSVGSAAGYSITSSLIKKVITGSQRVFLAAGQEAISSTEVTGKDMTFISTNRIYTDGPLQISQDVNITFMAPSVTLNEGFSVSTPARFQVVSSY